MDRSDADRRVLTVGGILLFLAILIATLAWAKWVLYAHKIPATATSGSLSVSILTGNEAAPPAPSVQAALSYTIAYLGAIWPALVTGLLIAAALEAFLPPAALFRLLATRAWGSATIRGGASIGRASRRNPTAGVPSIGHATPPAGRPHPYVV